MFIKFSNRIKHQGLRSTICYLVFTVLFEKIGFEITKVLNLTISSPCSMPSDIIIYRNIKEIPKEILSELYREYGEKYISQLHKKFLNNSILAMGMLNNKPTSSSWLADIKTDQEFSLQPYWLISNCFTFPNYRGLGFYPKSIKALCAIAYLESKKRKRANIFIETSVANKASLNGIKLCGFLEYGTFLKYRDKLIFKTYKLS